ncbi:MAG: biotin/lipoyl-containing protein [Nitrospinota bacterium]
MKKFKITVEDKTYEIAAERDAADPSLMRISVDGKAHTVRIEEEEAPQRSSGPRPAATPPPRSGGGGKIIAQLPGTVLSVDVSEGDSVSAGDKVLVIEAMKMENIITTEVGGAVLAVHVKEGDKVEAGQELVEIA